MLLLLDTNIIIDILNGIHATSEFVDRHQTRDYRICTCDVVVAEVLSGTRPADRSSVDSILDTFDFLPSTPEVGRLAGHWRYDLARRGIALATSDAIVAATAVVWNAALVTRNQRHFSMPELTVLPVPRISS